MSERERFLAAICAEPEEDTPRLAFADWLDENGEPDRAAFIRAQVRLASLPRYHPDWLPAAHAILRTWGDHLQRWRAELPRIPGVEWGEFRRGFVEEVAVSSPGNLVQKGRRVAVAVPLCGVTLESWADLSVLARSRVLPRLRRLGGGFHDAAVRTVLRLPNLPPLTHLDLHTGQVGINGAAAIAGCPRLRGLTELNLSENQIDDPGLTAVARSPHLRSLRVLNVAENPGVRAYSVAALAASPVAAGLEELYLGPCGGSNGAAALAGSGRFTRLGALDLDDDALRADGVRAIAESANFAGLTGLRLRGVFGSAGAEAIAASPHLTGLRDLFLVGCGIGDAGAAALADSPNAARLRTLNLGLNNLTDAAALALAKSPHLDGLRAGWLHLGGNRGITPAGVDALRDRFGYDPTSGAGPGGPPFTPESVRF